MWHNPHTLSTGMQYNPVLRVDQQYQHSAHPNQNQYTQDQLHSNQYNRNQYNPNQYNPNQYSLNQYIQNTEHQYNIDNEQGQYQDHQAEHQDAAEPKRQTSSVFDFQVVQNGNVRNVQPQLLMVQGSSTSSTGLHVNLVQSQEHVGPRSSTGS